MEYQILRQMVEKFARTYGSARGLLCAHAPGRVNLIGEHTDYNGGFVLPMAVSREILVLFRPVDRGPVRLWSENYGQWDEFDLADISPSPDQPWANYVRGVAHVLLEAGLPVRPIEGIVYGDIPIGAGLSSSAALEVSSALALLTHPPGGPDRKELALLCQRAENAFVGVNCGIMDQFVSLHAEQDRAVLIDCRSLDYDLVPLESSVVRVVVCNTMVHHELGASAYNERRATCESAAAAIARRVPGVKQLRDVSSELLQGCRDLLSEVELKRARHVVTENERVSEALTALREGDNARFGELMNASHESLDRDYEVTCDELNVMVRLARRQRGVLGARMTGGGFGGCTVNLVLAEEVDRFSAAMAEGYREQTGLEPGVYEFLPVRGARVERI